MIVGELTAYLIGNSPTQQMLRHKLHLSSSEDYGISSRLVKQIIEIKVKPSIFLFNKALDSSKASKHIFVKLSSLVLY